MRLTPFGTRGSIPASGSELAGYGGNIASAKVRGDDAIRRLGAWLPPDLTRDIHRPICT